MEEKQAARTIKINEEGQKYIPLKVEGYDELSHYVFSLTKSTELIGLALENIESWNSDPLEIKEIADCLQWISRLNQKLRLYGEYETLDESLNLSE